MDTATATGTTRAHSQGARSKRTFARHFGEMLLAMLLGMAVLGGLTALLFRAAGGTLGDASGAVRVLIMGVNMTLPMVAWMKYRGHDTARTAEMAAAMLVPSLVAAALVAGGALGSAGALALQHSVMVPAMLGVMLWRYDAYARHRPESGDAEVLGG